MVLGWLRPRPTSVYALIERKQYAKAVEFLKEELRKKKGDRRLRTQLADVLAMASRPKEALELYGALADDLALQGQAAQAIAVLKKMQGLAPGREDVEEKLAYLIKQQDAPAPSPWLARQRAAMAMGEVPPPPVEEMPSAAPEFGMEEIADAPPEELDRDEIVALIESALTPGEGGEPIAEPAGVTTPLFRGLQTDELVAVMRGLVLRTYLPGEIVVTEGEEGGSLFVVTSGGVRAFVRDERGRSRQVRELREGDFFGEASLLESGRRTATVTAAARCELLELDRATLDQIASTHPHVLEVMREFHAARDERSFT